MPGVAEVGEEDVVVAAGGDEVEGV